MRHEQKTTMQSLARGQQLHASPPPKDDELSFLDGDDNADNQQHFPAASLFQNEIPLSSQLFAELVGTYILVLLGCGGAFVSLYGNDVQSSSYTTTTWMMWTIGAMLGIYSAAGISGGHLNPAVTLAFCGVRPTAFRASKVIPYFVAQIVGATLAACTLLVLFHAAIQAWEEQHLSLATIPSKCLVSSNSGGSIFLYGVKSDIKACQPYDERQLQSLSAFAGFWSLLPSSHVSSGWHATLIEAFGTAFVSFIIFSVTSALYPVPSAAVPPVVAVALGSILYVLGPLVMGGAHLNPASAIGRRIAGMLWLVWKHRQLTLRELKPLLELVWYDVLPYILGPLLGGPLGAFLAEAMQPAY